MGIWNPRDLLPQTEIQQQVGGKTSYGIGVNEGYNKAVCFSDFYEETHEGRHL